jgi:hypothetical protein
MVFAQVGFFLRLSVLTAELCRQTNMLVADHQEVLLHLQEVDLTALLADEFLKTRHRGRVSALLADLNPWKDMVFDASGVTSGVLPAAIAYWQQHTGPLSVSGRCWDRCGSLTRSRTSPTSRTSSRSRSAPASLRSCWSGGSRPAPAPRDSPASTTPATWRC